MELLLFSRSLGVGLRKVSTVMEVSIAWDTKLDRAHHGQYSLFLQRDPLAGEGSGERGRSEEPPRHKLAGGGVVIVSSSFATHLSPSQHHLAQPLLRASLLTHKLSRLPPRL
ncbi:hypothetical protein QVD17_05756 [Tagetes erecta]|uniref:Uncharacterized protein n=1 Tax=Tagetes erecta TaxID=13708 RepID=A0AAD8LJA1_TARER|nr:hypothetical protein QVD17_05756 [Tagetes erecta]